jgi:sulfur-oxidizing protein SoxY
MAGDLFARLRRAGLCAALFGLLSAPALAQSDETWMSLKPDIFGGREISDGADILAIDAPVRAEDAAVVPVTVRALKPQAGESAIKAITLVVDENPAPVAATISFGPAADTASFSTRLRVNSYSYIPAIAEMSDGSLRMAKRFVKASGGCSAPALKDEDKSVAEIGQLKLRQFTGADEAAKDYALSPGDSGGIEAQLMIHHPNYSGLQMDQVTMLYIPAHFIRQVELKRGEAVVFKMEGGISLSENPSFRFVFRKEGTGDLSVMAVDTKDSAFTKSWPVERPAS